MAQTNVAEVWEGGEAQRRFQRHGFEEMLRCTRLRKYVASHSGTAARALRSKSHMLVTMKKELTGQVIMGQV